MTVKASAKSSDWPSSAAPRRPIYAIFEGGGAKGIAHIGALQAIQENGLEIVGVAGTSAGALAAVLTAIGLEASDVMDASDPEKHILAPMTPVQLLGEAEWKRLGWLRHFGKWAGLAGLVGGAPLASIVSPCNAGTALHILRYNGLFSTQNIRTFINTVIRNRLKDINRIADLGREIPDDVTFAVLAQDWPTVIPLKIVATDVDQGTLELFDAYRTPDVIVAEAVAASISIPIAFQPALIPSYRPGRFADGGMVANLPIWAFAEDKLAYEREHYSSPPVPTVGFTLEKPDKPVVNRRYLRRLRIYLADKADQGMPGYAGRLLRAALQGSQGTTLEFLEDVTMIRLKSELDTMDFDRSWEDYDAARRAGFEQANRHLRLNLEIKPDLVRLALSTVREMVLEEVNAKRRRRRKPLLDQLRVNFIEPSGRHSLRVVAGVGMEGDADDRLLLDRRGRGAAYVFRGRSLSVFQLGSAHIRRELEYMTKYERALVRKDVLTVMCVPIFADGAVVRLAPTNRPEPVGVLAIDCDQDIASELDTDHIKDMLTDQSIVIHKAVYSESNNG